MMGRSYSAPHQRKSTYSTYHKDNSLLHTQHLHSFKMDPFDSLYHSFPLDSMNRETDRVENHQTKGAGPGLCFSPKSAIIDNRIDGRGGRDRAQAGHLLLFLWGGGPVRRPPAPGWSPVAAGGAGPVGCPAHRASPWEQKSEAGGAVGSHGPGGGLSLDGGLYGPVLAARPGAG